ncbi:medium-chain acyl-CoA ligase ACSF2, mitochondrial-like isoform X2 [Photinus pyralis]|uniref:medium-chain acyl-CoA ligase ACSF2, mitochondrial-like isoform X2 n=1 Tax=Photinus pyralis TaxID=7054 RepID=UPI001266FD2B|nr:medium-chain acyl-CoA ligase ACSF2, mitochondrial-like isoform X2 [Photinus pyralis]
MSQTSASTVPNSGKPLKYLTIGNLIENAAGAFGEKCALVSVVDNRRVSYKEILHQSDKLAAGFSNLGLEKGDRIGLWAPNIVEWVIAFIASARAGLTTVVLDPTYEPIELKNALVKCKVKAIICPDEYKDLHFYDKLCDLLPEIATCDGEILRTNSVSTLKTIIIISERRLRGTYSYSDVMNLTDVVAKISSPVSPDDICMILFSSGTTGKPKAICLRHFQVVNNSYVTGKRLQLCTSGQIYSVQVPLFHVFGVIGCLLAATHFGSTLVFPSPLYNSKANLQALVAERCTIVCGTPTMFVDLLTVQKKQYQKLWLKQALIGAAPCTLDLIQRIKRNLKINRVEIVYGSTEMTGIAFQSITDCNSFEGWGYIGDHVEAKVVDANHNLVPFGSPGELWVRGYLIMAEYYDEPEQTKIDVNESNWFKTGDLFVLNEDGHGKVVGRLKDVVIRGGETICPGEVEEVLNTHPDILEAYVIGIGHERLGEELCACVKLEAGATLNLSSLRQFCAGKISTQKIPTQLRVVDSFPKTTSGKIQKSKLRDQFSAKSVYFHGVI